MMTADVPECDKSRYVTEARMISAESRESNTSELWNQRRSDTQRNVNNNNFSFSKNITSNNNVFT